MIGNSNSIYEKPNIKKLNMNPNLTKRYVRNSYEFFEVARTRLRYW